VNKVYVHELVFIEYILIEKMHGKYNVKSIFIYLYLFICGLFNVPWLAKYYYDSHINEDGMDRACSTHVREARYISNPMEQIP
jgi:hypothetical protein